MNKWRLSVALTTVFFCFVGAFATAFAQEIIVSGSVLDDRGKAVAGVSIKAKGIQAGGFSDSKGLWRVRIPNANGATLVFNYIGFKPFELKATESKSDIVVRLQEDVLKTSEIVVTGVASSIKKANSPTSIGTISEKELLPAPAQTVDQAFAGKFAGVSIRQNSGAPGGGMSVTLRGATTLLGGSQPLYIVDGVIINNNTNSGGQNTVTAAGAGGATGGASQEQSVNRIADLNPNDIEDVQVLKGPSAAAAYGSKAASGVIIIKTKQGRAGKTSITVNQQIGINTLQRKLGLRKFSSEQEVRDWNPDFVDAYKASNGAFFDHEEFLYGNVGFVNETDVNAKGGNEMTQFNIGGTFRSDQGIIKNTGFERLGARLNLNHNFSDKLRAKIGINYTRSRSDRGFSGNSNNDNVSIIYGVSVMPTFVDYRKRADGTYPALLLNPSNPYEVADRVKNTEYVSRIIATANLQWEIYKAEESSLEFVFQGGADFASQRNVIVDPSTTLHQRVKPQPGLFGVSDAQNLFSNMFLTLVHRYEPSAGLSFTTQAGAQFENQQSNSVVNVSNGFPSDLENITGAASQTSVQTIINRYDRGFYLQEDVDIFGKFFVTASLRGDAASANGDPTRFFLFPKVAGSVQLASFDFWDGVKSIFPQFKFRAAYGEAGTPVNSISAKYNLLSSSQNNFAGLGSGLALAARKGNPDIRPERASEIEAGFDFTVGENNLIAVEITGYRKYITDLILSRALPTSSGFSSIFENAGEMENLGLEVSLSFNAVRTELVTWQPRVNFFSNTAKITKLGVPPYNSGGFGAGYGANRIQEGVSPTAIFGRQNLGTTPSTPGVATGVYNLSKPAGDANPMFQVGFANSLNIGNLNFYFLIDWRQGGSVVNLTQALYTEGGLFRDQAEQARILAEAAKPASQGGTTPYIQDASFVKFREASLNYTFDKQALGGDTFEFLRIGVSGRNLLTITPYTGYDPEVSNFGNIITSGGQDVAPFPSSRSFFFNIAVGF
ncbi:MAG: SusC/RagA family TonB-linked outer membrane protein [Ignavibacteria bacterium]|nr:SusC/RagA family TonB-linked outer membrane protein [Ignavibacteria bacterium]